MQDVSILKIAMSILGGALLLCLGGIIFLASANPARAIPDVLVATTGLVSGGLVGILVPTKSPLSRRNEAGRTDLLYALLVVAAFLLVIWLLFAVVR